MEEKADNGPSSRTVVKIIIALTVLVAFAVAALFYIVLSQVEPAEMVDSSEDETQQTDDRPAAQLTFKKTAEGFKRPVDIVFGDGELFVVEQRGVVRLLDNATTVLDIRSKVDDSGNEMGLLGMAFDPDFEQNNYVYVNYTRSLNGQVETVIARYELDQGATSEKIILTQEQPFQNHNAGDIAFGPDGYLYVPLGDGGSGGDPNGNGQNMETLLGKILRIDVKNGDPYSVPEDNPFVGEAGRDEIWALGFRNPWRLSFDGETGDLYVGDVGQGSKEEIDIVKAGGNYGWKCREGTQKYGKGCGKRADFIEPLTEYDHAEGQCGGSITGGFVYRGQTTTSLRDKYMFADFCRGNLYAYDLTAGELTIAAATDFQISTFGVDGDGEMYFADFGSGTIYQLVDAN